MNLNLRAKRLCFAVLAGLILVLSACGPSTAPAPAAKQEPGAPPAAPVVPRILEVYPRETAPGKKFNVQPDGTAALGIKCENATFKTVILWDGQRLPTVFGNPQAVSATVAAELFAKAGAHTLVIENEAGKSNEVIFFVRNPAAQ